MNLKKRGFCDRILRVDLTTGAISVTPLPEDVMPLVLGGKGLGAWLLYTEQAPGVDPLGPDNHLIFHTGPLTGTTAPTAGRFGVTTRSPATGTYFDAYCGGYWGQMLKYAGYDALVVTGAASGPVMLVIDDDAVELRPADHLWGTTVPEATHALQTDLGHDWQSLVIGPPGEQQRNVAGIFNEIPRVGARRSRRGDGIEAAQSDRRARHRVRAGVRRGRRIIARCNSPSAPCACRAKP